MSRTFTIEAIYKNGHKIRFDGGRYMSDTPSSAARKAFTQAYRHTGAKGKMSLNIHIRETTQNSLHKTYKYKVSRVQNPTEASWVGESVVFNYTTKVKAI
jgi:hypothetical protein